MRTYQRILPAVLCLAFLFAPRHAAAQMDYQPPPDLEPLHRPYDQLLDSYVRDGIVYYHALKTDRAKLDRYVASLGSAEVAAGISSWNKPRQIAFWINAYNAISLQTAISHYPGMTMQKIPGGFTGTKHAVAGKVVTLEEIENGILAAYNDPRIYLVLGRSAMGSGRLRSEAFSGTRLEAQLAQAVEQFSTRPEYIKIDPLNDTLSVSAILSWRSKPFIDAYAGKAFDLPGRTPIELAAIGMIRPYLLPIELEYLQKNTFKLAYLDFDWALNDRAGIRH